MKKLLILSAWLCSSFLPASGLLSLRSLPGSRADHIVLVQQEVLLRIIIVPMIQ
jgi:hypothetical protein